MPVDVNWLDENQRVLHYRFRGQWNWDEYFIALNHGREMQKQVDCMTCVVNDMSATHYLPDDFIEKARSLSLTRPTNTGLVVCVSNDSHRWAVNEILERLYPDMGSDYPLVATLEDALTRIDCWFISYEKALT